MPIRDDPESRKPRPARDYGRPESKTSRRVDEHLCRLEGLLGSIDKNVREFQLEQSNAVTELTTKVDYAEKELALIRDAMDGIRTEQIKEAQHERKVLLKALAGAVVSGGGMGYLAHVLGGG